MNKNANLSLSTIIIGLVVIIVCLVVTVLIVRGAGIANDESTSQFEEHQQNLDECISGDKPCVDVITGDKPSKTGGDS